MKLLVSVIAIAIAFPALAQTAPANPHAGHGQASAPAKAETACTPEHAKLGHCKLAPAAEKTAKDGGCRCEKAKAAGKKMPCCDKDKADAAK